MRIIHLRVGLGRGKGQILHKGQGGGLWDMWGVNHLGVKTGKGNQWKRGGNLLGFIRF